MFVQKLTAYDGQAHDHFGTDVVLSSGVMTLVVTVAKENTGGTYDDDLDYLSGGAYVYILETTGLPSFVQKIVAGDEDPMWAAASSGAFLFLGAPFSSWNQGSVQVYRRVNVSLTWEFMQTR